MNDNISDVLNSISPSVTRREWLKVIWAAKAAGANYNQVLEWSKNGDNYKNASEVAKAWNDYNGSVGAGTLFWLAKQHGWRGKIQTLNYTPTEPPKIGFNIYEFKRRQAKIIEWYESADTRSLDIKQYLGMRGINIAPPSTLRALKWNIYKRDEYGNRMVPRPVTALVSLFMKKNKVRGWQHIYLDDNCHKLNIDGIAAKQNFVVMPNLPPEMRLKGAAIQLYEPAEVMGVAEGVETALAVREMTNLPMWATGGCGQMYSLNIPECVKFLWIFADKGEAGERAARELQLKAKLQGVEAKILTSKRSDFLEDMNAGDYL